MPNLVMEETYDFINVYIENRSIIPKGQFYICLQERIPVGGMKGKEKKEIAIYFNFKKRGIFKLDKLGLRFTGYLGLLYLHKNYKISSFSYVYPLFYPLPQDLYLSDEEGNKTSYSFPSVQGEEFHSLRDYQPQDPLKIIAWKPSAKKGKLLSKSFERLKRGSIKILIDNIESNIDSTSIKEFDQLLRFVHSLLIPSFSLNIPVIISDLSGKEDSTPKDLETLRKYLAEIELLEDKDKKKVMLSKDYDVIFSIDYNYWKERIKSNRLVSVEFHKRDHESSKFFIYTPKEDPQEFLSRFLISIQG